MCKKTQFKYCPSTIDVCMIRIVAKFQNQGFNVVACCCGHGKYPKTIIIKDAHGKAYDSVSKIDIPRKRRFYKKDKQGYYYLPECVK